MTSSTIATRLPEPLLRDVRRFAKRGRLGPSEALRAIVAEWVAMAKYPAIEFRDGPAGRRPALRIGPDICEIVMVAREVGPDVAAMREHPGPHLSAEVIAQALAYAAEHREVAALVARGLDVAHAVDAALAEASDVAVFDWAIAQRRVVVTRDYTDFSRLAEVAQRHGRSFPGVLLISPALTHDDVGGIASWTR